jgi:SAM-dependent methyltransferase
MRIATRRAAGLDAAGWTAELRDEVEEFFDGLADEWHTRSSPERTAVVVDALSRGLGAVDDRRGLGAVDDRGPRLSRLRQGYDGSPKLQRRLVGPAGVLDGIAVEVGSGIGVYSDLLAKRFSTVVAVDLSMAMLKLAPTGPARRVQADGARLPLPDACAAAIVLVNAFLFPHEVERVLSPGGALVWVNTSGEQTPIYLSENDVVAQLRGEWTGVSSRAGEGHWCVLTRASNLFAL